MNDETFAERVERYLAGCLPEGERAELAALVREDARRRELFVDQVRQHLHLDALFGEETTGQTRRRLELIRAVSSQERDHTLVQNVQAKLGLLPRSRRLAFRLAVAGVAAALLLVGGIAMWSWNTEAPLARLDQVQGEVYVVVGPIRTPAATGQALTAGHGLETDSDDSAAVVVYPDGTRLELGPGTKLTELSEQDGKRLTLAEGFLLADVAPQPAGRPMRVTTPHAEVVVRGTRFRLSNLPQATHIELEQGSVQVTRQDDQQSIELKAGYYAVVGAEEEAVLPEPLLPRPLPPRVRNPRLSLEGRFSSLAFSPDSQTFATGTNGQADLWEAGSGKHLASHNWNGEWVHTLAYSPDGKTLALGGKNSRGARLWQVGTAQFVQLGSGGMIQRLIFSPDGRTLALSRAQHSFQLWDPVQRVERLTLLGHTGNVTGLAFGPDSQTLVSGSADGTVKQWDTASGLELAALAPGTSSERGRKGYRVLAVAFSPDGKTVAAGLHNGTIQLWNLAARQQRASLRQHAGAITALVFSPDGKWLASGSNDRMVKLWDPAAALEEVTLLGHDDMIVDVAFSPDGKTLASIGKDRKANLWNVLDATRK